MVGDQVRPKIQPKPSRDPRLREEGLDYFGAYRPQFRYGRSLPFPVDNPSGIRPHYPYSVHRTDGTLSLPAQEGQQIKYGTGIRTERRRLAGRWFRIVA